MKTLVLVGSGEFTSVMEEVDKSLIDSIILKKEIIVAILPTAAGEEPDYNKWIDMGVSHFSKLGVKPIGVPIVKKEHADNSEYLDIIRKSSIIYFSGGNPDYLFKQMGGTKIWQEIMQNYQSGGILIGSSAGAMIMGSYYIANPGQSAFDKNKPDEEPVFKAGFNLYPYPVIPHYQRALKNKPFMLKKVLEKSPTKSYLGIDENTVLIIQNGEEKGLVKGEGRVYYESYKLTISPPRVI